MKVPFEFTPLPEDPVAKRAHYDQLFAENRDRIASHGELWSDSTIGLMKLVVDELNSSRGDTEYGLEISVTDDDGRLPDDMHRVQLTRPDDDHGAYYGRLSQLMEEFRTRPQS